MKAEGRKGLKYRRNFATVTESKGMMNTRHLLAVLLFTLVAAAPAGAAQMVVESDSRWRAVTPAGNLEGKPIDQVGQEWEKVNAGWNSDLKYDDSQWGMSRFPYPYAESWAVRGMWASGGISGGSPAYFRRVVEVPGKVISATVVSLLADDDVILYVNGKPAVVDANGETKEAGPADVTPLFHTGKNLLAIKAQDSGGLKESLELRIVITYQPVATGPAKYALSFDGSQYAIIGPAPELDSKDITIEAWIKPAKRPDQAPEQQPVFILENVDWEERFGIMKGGVVELDGQQQPEAIRGGVRELGLRFIRRGEPTSGGEGVILWNGDAQGARDPFCLSVFSDGRLGLRTDCEAEPENHLFIYSDDAFSVGTWQHVAVVISGSQKAMWMVVDGKRQMSTTALPSGPVKGSSFLALGALIDGNPNGRPYSNFAGEIDEVRIWGTARTDEEIKRDMRRTLKGNEPGLLAYWNFDEGDGQLAHDLATHKKHAVLGLNATADPSDPLWVGSGAPLSTP